MKTNLKNKALEILILISIFINSLILLKSPAEIYIGYLAYLIVIPMCVMRYKIPGVMSAVFGILLLTGFFYVVKGDNTMTQFIKISLGLFMAYLFYYYVLRIYNTDTEFLFRLYLKGAWIVTIIGAIQFISFKIGFAPGYDYSYIFNKWGFISGGNLGIRVNAVFGEPTYYATVMSPAVFVAAHNLLRKPYYFSRMKSALILVVYLLTFSGSAYVGILLIGLLLLSSFGFLRYSLVLIPVLVFGFIFAYNNVGEFRERWEGTVEAFTKNRFTVGETHGSSIVLYNNYHIALENFKQNPFFGTGLGSHPTASSRYSLIKESDPYGEQNTMDANSMFLRLMSETGLFGLVVMLFILFRFYVKRCKAPEENKPYWIISNAIFVLIILNLLRQGHYFLNGFPFFIWLYYYNWRNQKILKMAGYAKNR